MKEEIITTIIILGIGFFICLVGITCCVSQMLREKRLVRDENDCLVYETRVIEYKSFVNVTETQK